jgi:hypothetical protein
MAAFTVIGSTTMDATGQSITMSSIPDTYDHLYLTASVREGGSAFSAPLEFRFNDDSSPYSNTYLNVSTGTPTSSRATSSATGDVIGLTGAGGTLADTFSSIIMWIPHYANTANGKQVFITSVCPNDSVDDGEWFLRLTAGLWDDTAAIDKFRMQGAGGPELQIGTSVVLYGITGA